MTGFIPPMYGRHLKKELESRMELPVDLVVETCGGCESCDRAVGISAEMGRLSGLVRVTSKPPKKDPEPGSRDGHGYLPRITVVGHRSPGLVFYGAPLGSEVDVLVDAVFASSRRRSRLPKSLVDRLLALENNLRVQIYVSPACRRCPPVARFLMEAGIETPRIRVEVVEAFEFPGRARAYDVRAVPTVVIDPGDVRIHDASVPRVASALFEAASAGPSR